MSVTTIDGGVSGVRRERLASVLELVATAHLLFPVVIILCAVAGFFVGIAIHPLVLPLSVLLAIVGLRTLGNPWRDVAGVVGVAVITHLAAGAIAYEFPDNSWDGLAYQQEAVVRLAAGWNPVTESASRYGVAGVAEEPFVEHYPKASWITAAAVLKATGHIETGKLFNLTLMFAVACLCLSALLRLTLLPIAWAAAVSALIALNPVFVYQGMTFYVDNLVASTLTVVVTGLVVFIAARRRQALVVAMLAAAIAINLKFTGLIYTAILFGLAALVVWRQYGLPAASRYAAAAAAAGIFSAVALGYAPYVHNLVEHHDPFFPATPKYGMLDTTTQVPANLLHADRFSRFLVSSFSRSETVRPPHGTRAKFPLSIGPQERRGLYSADLESGGFGPLYGALLLLAGVAAVTLCINRSSRRVAGVVLLIAGCVLATIFVHRETWWARYIPQAWLLPMLIAIPSLCAPRRSVQWWLGAGLVGLAVVNLSVVGANVGWRQLKYARDIRVALQQMSSTAPPVTVYLGPFRSLRQRLTEARIDFRMIETPTDSGVTGHARNAIPTPGNVAFWLDAQPTQGSSR
jgi:hypothetical protein